MPVTKTFKTPGVYVTEEDAFPPSIVGVETALPAFVGYTEKAEIAGKPMFGKPKKISSFAEFVAIFGEGFKPVMNIKAETTAPDGADAYDATFIDDKNELMYVTMTQEAKTKFNLYGAIKLFFENGGERCYVVSVQSYVESKGHVKEDKLIDGLKIVADIVGPTMLVVPDAVLIQPDTAGEPFASAKYYQVVTEMLTQCGDLQDRVAVLDVYGAGDLSQTDPTKFQDDLTTVVDNFYNGTGTDNLSYGMAYFPFLKTGVISDSDITYEYFEEAELKNVLTAQAKALYPKDAKGKDTKAYLQVAAMIDRMATTKPDPTSEFPYAAVDALNGDLTNALPVLKQLESQLALRLGVLPPSAAMAGVMARVDGANGVWNAPANVSLNSVIGPNVDINNDQQGDLNVPLNGKAIDVIRSFPGRGTIPWGARTMLGNSNDWRYVQVRRTLIYIEQSIKNAMMPFVFAANDGKTWSTVVSAINNFLQQTWSQGGLMGNTPDKAFSVECGLGSTMTAQDVMEGYMVVEVRVAMIRPAEFIVLNFKQKMPEA